MIEYRLENLTKNLERILTEIGVFIAEEEFKGQITHLVYADECIDDFLKSFGVIFKSKVVEDTGWQDKWKEFISEGWLTNSIYFIFDNKSFNDNRKTLYINPALAFGTGNHPTTKIAARLLEPVVKSRSLLDIGTGSGILAIAAKISGSKEVYCFDLDPQTISNCKENIANNGYESSIFCWVGEITSIKNDKSFNIVSANIISSVLLSMKDKVHELAEDYIIFSGILESEYTNIIDQLMPIGFKVDEKLSIKEWCGVRFKRY